MSNEYPIFDSLSHPTVDGNWILPKYKKGIAKFSSLIDSMDENNISKSVVCGMGGIGGYSPGYFLQEAKKFGDRLYPIAFIEPHIFSDIESYIRSLYGLGYRGVKIHPRIAKLTIFSPFLVELINICHKYNMVIFICTYFFSNCNSQLGNNIDNLTKLLINSGDAKVILLHSGGVKLLEFMELARAFDNILLDLSFTMSKYRGSSLDMDIQFMFNNFDRRICIGSDFPEISHLELRKSFDFFKHNVNSEKLKNIAFENLNKFLYE
jgi:predicted TIM-barrel fold metal-dependent hydrolase